MKKEYIKPEIKRQSIYNPTAHIFSHGKTPLVLINNKDGNK